MNSVPPGPVCPLCGSDQRADAGALNMVEVWRGLERQWRTVISTAVRAETPDTVHLVRCLPCGLQYFLPLVAGSTAFYEELMSQVPYEDDRWEFRVVDQIVGGRPAVVDVGCGPGHFLSMMRDRARRVVGIDHNPMARAALRRTGIEDFDGTFDQFSLRETESFDVVTAFQLVEHLVDVAEVVEPARRCLRPGGRLFVSTPNRRRIRLDQLDPLDCPPHHLSRWSEDQFVVLGERFGLELRTIRLAEPLPSDATRAWIEARLTRPFSGRDRPPGRVVRRVVGGVARVATHYLHRPLSRRRTWTSRGLYGHTMLAEFARP